MTMDDEAEQELERLRAPISPEDLEVVEDWDWQADLGWDEHLAQIVAERRERTVAANRQYAMTLAVIRQAFGLTQEDVARQMHSNQAQVSRIEAGGDMLLSTLLEYLAAAGLGSRLVVPGPSGERIEVDLRAVLARGGQSRR